MKNTLTNMIAFKDEMEILKSGDMILPWFVDLHTSNRCNHKCRGCAYAGLIDGAIMSKEKHFQAIDQFLNMGVKAFDFAGGGEPTLLPYLPELLHYIHLKGANYGLITNGSNLSDELIDVLLDSATYVRFSLEASNPPMFLDYKQVNDWDRVVCNVRDMIEERMMKQSFCEISVKFSVGKTMQGSKHFQDAINIGESLGVDWITFKALRHEPEELIPNKLSEQEYLLCEVLGTDADIRAKVRYWLTPLKQIPQCWMNPAHVVMDHLGNLYLCCYYYYRIDKHCIGNIFEDSFAEIWFSDKHWEKIKTIDKTECAKVDCKFFHHHLGYELANQRGKVNFL